MQQNLQINSNIGYLVYSQAVEMRELLSCPCGTCRDSRTIHAPEGCCRCSCEFGGHCFSPNLGRYRCCPKCPCPCYDFENKKTRCCRCDCKCGYSFRKQSWWGSSAPKCAKCRISDFSSISSTCFPTTALVKLETGISIAMSELQVGDKVQTGMISIYIYIYLYFYLNFKHSI